MTIIWYVAYDTLCNYERLSAYRLTRACAVVKKALMKCELTLKPTRVTGKVPFTYGQKLFSRIFTSRCFQYLNIFKYFTAFFISGYL